MNRTLTFERWYPTLFAALAVGLWCHFGAGFPASGKEFLAVCVSFAAILVGFLATAQAILMSLPADSVMGRLRASDYIEDLVSYLRTALLSLTCFSILNIGGFFLDPDRLSGSFQNAWMFLGVFGLCSFYRVTTVVLAIMKMRPDPRGSQP